jgi:uncharacterized protein YkwD
MKILHIFLFSILFHQAKTVLAQHLDSNLSYCNTAKDIGYLTSQEKAVIFYINVVRSNPKLFAQTYLKNYLDTAPIKQTEYLNSLLKELNILKPLEILQPQYDLYEVAKKHATEMGIQGKTGHVTLNGLTFERRAAALSYRYEKAMENCQYGYVDGLSIVIDLLIDEDIPDLSHRKSLLNNEVKFIGAAIRKHKIYRHNCVIELGYKLKK